MESAEGRGPRAFCVKRLGATVHVTSHVSRQTSDETPSVAAGRGTLDDGVERIDEMIGGNTRWR